MKLSIGVVAFNEENFLSTLFEDLKNQKYDKSKTEIILIDSNSTDNTKKIMEKFKEENPQYFNVQVLDNPKRVQAAGWNVAIKNFKGDILARIDAHTRVTPNYAKYVIENIQKGEDVVGGKRPNLIEDDKQWSRVLLQVETSLFGSSINKSRRAEKKSYVKTMFHAAYRREVIDKVGLFNENLLRTEDNEYHYRVRKAGYKLLYDPRIVSYQFARPNFKSMLKQKFANGDWVGRTLKVCPGCLSVYHLIPLFFLLGLILSALLAMLGHQILLFTILSFYFIFAFISTIVACINTKFYILSLLLPILFFILHIAYGLGTLIGLLKKRIDY